MKLLREPAAQAYLPGEKLGRRAQNIIRAAYSEVYYYKKIFADAGINPRDIKTWADFRRIPFSDKLRLRAYSAEQIISCRRQKEKLKVLRSSGISGEPLSVFLDGQAGRWRRRAFLNMYFEHGRRWTDRVAVLTSPQNFPRFPVYAFPREHYLSALEPSSALLPRLERLRPDIILGYAATLKTLAEEIVGTGNKVIRPRVIFLTGEMFSAGERDFLERVFGARVYAYYAATESGIIGWECRMRRGYHVDEDNIIFELAEEEALGPRIFRGEAQITTLHNYAMPLIRYRLGDICRLNLESCACGSARPRIEIVEGRRNDRIVLNNGKKIAPYIIMAKMDEFRAVKKYRVVQQEDGTVDFFIFPESGIESFAEKILRGFKDIFEQQVKIQVKAYVPGGETQYKHETVISRIRQND